MTKRIWISAVFAAILIIFQIVFATLAFRQAFEYRKYNSYLSTEIEDAIQRIEMEGTETSNAAFDATETARIPALQETIIVQGSHTPQPQELFPSSFSEEEFVADPFRYTLRPEYDDFFSGYSIRPGSEDPIENYELDNAYGETFSVSTEHVLGNSIVLENNKDDDFPDEIHVIIHYYRSHLSAIRGFNWVYSPEALGVDPIDVDWQLSDLQGVYFLSNNSVAGEYSSVALLYVYNNVTIKIHMKDSKAELTDLHQLLLQLIGHIIQNQIDQLSFESK